MNLSTTEIAEAVGAPTTPFSPEKGALSTLFEWFGDDSRLCVIAKDLNMKPVDTDLGFAHGLGHLGDRDLNLVFPAQGAEAVADRVPFLEVPITCWTLTEAGAQRLAPKRREDVIASYRGTRGGTQDFAEGLHLISPLLEWLSERPGFAVDDRKSYRTWQYKGRQVLTLRLSGTGGVELVAGVKYSKPQPGLAPVNKRLIEPITQAELTMVQTAIDVACERRDSGADEANAEHLLQERLRTEFWKRLGLRAPPLREVPVRRPVGYGYIDLVGAGKDGRVHVIETKLGPFERLVLQGLDYWIWATANEDALRDALDLTDGAGIEIDYVVAEKAPGQGVIGSYTSGQAEALHGAIRWRFTTVRDWTGTDAPEIQRLALRALPRTTKGRPAPRKAQPRWSVRLAYHLAEHAAADGATLLGGVFWPNVTDGLEADAAVVYERLLLDGLSHHMIGHVRSSQAFALNLFAPLGHDARRATVAILGIDAEAVSEPRFEWSDPNDGLSERTHASPHATQVDVRLDCTLKDGATVVCLIEVKLSEPDFNPCSAWQSQHNNRLDVCAQPGPFGNDTAACFQLRNHDRGKRRLYDTALGPLSQAASDSSGCWFRFGGNQVMRNTALARNLVTHGDATQTVVALCAPAAHRAIWRRWSEATARLDVPDVNFGELPADLVAQHHPNPRTLSERYLLEMPAT